MRQFTGGVSVEIIGGDTPRLTLTNPTGEKVFKDLSPAEVEAIREALPTYSKTKRRTAGKET